MVTFMTEATGTVRIIVADQLLECAQSVILSACLWVICDVRLNCPKTQST
jgi:hypothetical protein